MKHWKKCFSAGLIVFLLAAAAGCGSGGSSGNAGGGPSGSGQSGGGPSGSSGQNTVYEWKMGSIYTDPKANSEFNAFGLSMQKFVDLVNEKSNGRLVITPFYNSVLGGSQELFQKVRKGELEVFYGQPMAGADKRFGAFSVPYLFKNYEEVEKAFRIPDGPLFKLASQWMKEHKLVLLGSGASVFRGFSNSKHPVKKVEDLKDLTVRIYEDPIVAIYWKMVSKPIQLPFSEVYNALQTNVVDGLEFQATSVIAQKFDEIVKYYTDIDWQWTWGAALVVSEQHWNQLPDDLKQIVQQAAVDAMKYEGEQEKAFAQKALETLKEHGVEVYNLTPEEREEWTRHARGMDEEFKKAIGEDVWNQVMEAVESVRQ